MPLTNRIVECVRNADGTITPTNVEFLVYRYFSDDFDNAIKVFTCESGMKQFDKNGKVIISRTDDVGISQINLRAHGEKAKELGLNLWDTEQNLQYARILYSRYKWNPWVCKKVL
jgi:hypothetical protein